MECGQHSDNRVRTSCSKQIAAKLPVIPTSHQSARPREDLNHFFPLGRQLSDKAPFSLCRFLNPMQLPWP